MPAIVSNKATEDALREVLTAQGFDLSERRAHGETGTDIIATTEGERWHIEVIGFKSSPPVRAKDFYESFFRSVSRLNAEAKHCVIALPKEFKRGLPARVNQHRVAWQRIGEAFPELEIWLVDVSGKTCEKNDLERLANPWLTNGRFRRASGQAGTGVVRGPTPDHR